MSAHSLSMPAGPRVESPDHDRGLSLLMVFAGALFVIVGAVVVIGAVRQAWILIPCFALHLVMSAFVFVAIMRLLGDTGEEGGEEAG